MKVDLHIHTNCSDGIFTTEEVLQKSKSAGLSVISITDHDNLSAIEQAKSIGGKSGIEVIPGVEISTDIEDREVHILGYFIDIHNDELTKYLKFFREERVYRAERMVKNLNLLGINISMDQVKRFSKAGSVGRPHIAQALVESGYVNSFYEAFDRYIGNHCPAFERKIHVSAQSALKLINDAGGVSFIAHPGTISESVLMNLIKLGVDGIEVIHPSHSLAQVNFYKKIASQYYLLTSGGSDFHGGKREDEENLGKYYISLSEFEKIRNNVAKR